MFLTKKIFVLIPAPNMFKHISRNNGATIKASQKTAHDNFFLILGQNSHFFPQKWQHHHKSVIDLNLYIATNVLVYERWLVLKVWYMAGQSA